MTGVEKARQLFRDAGLAFPTIPAKFAARLKERGKWLFATLEIEMSPYNLQHYVTESDITHVRDYVVLAHSGHGVNSSAVQYYRVYGALRMFLHLGWGGIYMDATADAANIRNCFSTADEIVKAAKARWKLLGDRLTIVAPDSYGSYWSTTGDIRRKREANSRRPAAEVLLEALHWLRSL